MIIIVDLLIFASSGLILFTQILGFGQKIMIINDCIILAILLLVGYGLLVHMIIVLYGEGLVRGWNQISALEKQLNKIGNQFLIKNFNEKTNKKLILVKSVTKLKPEFDRIGIIMKIVVWMFTFYPFLLIPATILLNLDPLYYLILNVPQEYLPFPVWLLVHAARCIILFIGCAEVCRLFPLLLFIFISALRMANKCLHNLIFLTSLKQGKLLNPLINKHISLQLSIKLLAPFQENGSRFLIVAGILLSIMFNVATIKGFSVVPFYIYMFCLFVSLTIFCVCDLIFPFTYRVFEQSESFLRIGNEIMCGSLYFINNFKRKTNKKILHSIKPIRLYVGFQGYIFFGCVNQQRSRSGLL
jgi:hypothetical protein